MTRTIPLPNHHLPSCWPDSLLEYEGGPRRLDFVSLPRGHQRWYLGTHSVYCPAQLRLCTSRGGVPWGQWLRTGRVLWELSMIQCVVRLGTIVQPFSSSARSEVHGVWFVRRAGSSKGVHGVVWWGYRPGFRAYPGGNFNQRGKLQVWWPRARGHRHQVAGHPKCGETV